MKNSGIWIPTTILILLIILIASLHQNILLTNDLIIDHWENQLSIAQINDILEVRDSWSWANYIIVPFILIIKFYLITLWLINATILFGYKNTFKEIFRIVIIAEFIWLIPSFITLIWFGFIDTDYSLLEVQYFKPLSLLNFFEASEIEGWLIFPLQSLNLFEIAYMFVLAIGIKRVLNKGYMEALNFTVPVYGSALVIWIVFITFLSINLTT